MHKNLKSGQMFVNLIEKLLKSRVPTELNRKAWFVAFAFS